MSLVKQILEQRATAWHEAKALLDGAEAEGRALSAEEAEKFDNINESINALDAQRQKIEEAEARTRDAEAARFAAMTPWSACVSSCVARPVRSTPSRASQVRSTSAT